MSRHDETDSNGLRATVDTCDHRPGSDGNDHPGRYRPRGMDGPDLLAWIFERCRRTESGCLVWQGPCNAKGYSMLHYRGRGIGTHRLTYVLSKGPIADGLLVDHLCRTPGCVNPDHLEPVTAQENVLRGVLGVNRDGICAKCGGEMTGRQKSPGHVGGYRKTCRPCARKQKNDHYQRNRERILAALREKSSRA